MVSKDSGLQSRAIAQIQASPRIDQPTIDPTIWGAIERVGVPVVILLIFLEAWRQNQKADREQRAIEAEIDRKERAEDRKNLQDITNAAIARANNNQQILFDDLDIAIKACTEMSAIARRTEERCDRIEKLLSDR